ncbi:hypothetical protein CXG81DRAFT_27853 [Caulochytrium protostelioides]|uniref:Meckelin n=1 Tax=Caulochytrium protostelioides TaxID=1555241 RepID=A0A4P9X313_9FUNG|nr:hypothetical protein CXG81DRAFT_27853 [Caulochytrium protostelioides]|eukprot:RKO99391.1 hypothetical protein CXG81DRAFT_27853 [Caulochytrium protostelioides]
METTLGQTPWIALGALIAAGVVHGLVASYAWTVRNTLPGEPITLALALRTLVTLAARVASPLALALLALALDTVVRIRDGRVALAALDPPPLSLGLLLVLAAVGALLGAAATAFQQCRAAAFLVDTEPAAAAAVTAATAAAAGTTARSLGGHGGPGSPARRAAVSTAGRHGPSVWRSLFVMNEWCRLQTHRITNTPLTVLGLLVLLLATGWRTRWATPPADAVQQLAAAHPSETAAAVAAVVGHYERMAVVGLDLALWAALLLGQWLAWTVVRVRIRGSPLLNFVDALALANISIWIFDEPCHGYFLYGRSVHPAADVDLATLNAYLRQEAMGLVMPRGLDGTGQQAFEMIAAPALRATLERLLALAGQRDPAWPRHRPAPAPTAWDAAPGSAAAAAAAAATVLASPTAKPPALPHQASSFLGAAHPGLARFGTLSTLAGPALSAPDLSRDLPRHAAAVDAGTPLDPPGTDADGPENDGVARHGMLTGTTVRRRPGAPSLVAPTSAGARSSGGSGADEAVAPPTALADARARAAAALQSFVIAFLDRTLPAYRYAMMSKTAWQRLGGPLLVAPPAAGTITLLYADDSAYGRSLFAGLERDWLVVLGLLFAGIDAWTGHTALAGLVVYLVDATAMALRRHYGIRHFATTSLLDTRYILAL